MAHFEGMSTETTPYRKQTEVYFRPLIAIVVSLVLVTLLTIILYGLLIEYFYLWDVLKMWSRSKANNNAAKLDHSNNQGK